jgi:uncharacterized membrane protein YfcA
MQTRAKVEAGSRKAVPGRSAGLAAGFGAPIGLLGGLIGLGGAEFRLPVLGGLLGYGPREAVAVNLAVSLFTVASALAIRAGTLALGPVRELLPAMVTMSGAAVAAAWVGVGLVHRVSEERLRRCIFVLLLALGLALFVEAFVPLRPGGLDSASGKLALGLVSGIGIGLVSSALGVAGGELIIPTLVFGVGADIATAGTAALAISLPIVGVGVARHAHHGAFADRADLTQTVVPMGAASVVGAVAGGLLVGVTPVAALKVVLGLVLIVSAIRVFRA